MNILHVTEFFPNTINRDFTGGVEARTFYVARELAKHHRVTVLCSYTHGKRTQKLAGIQVLRVGPKRRYTSNVDPTRILFMIAAYITGKSLNADIIEGTNFINHTIAYHIGRATNTPVVFWTPDVWQGDWIANMGFGGVFGALVERYNLSRPNTHFIPISQTVAQKLLKSGVPPDRITPIYCGAEYAWIQKVTPHPRQKNAVISVSRLVKYKNVAILIRAFAHLVQKIPTAKLQLVGQGPEQKALRNLAMQLGVLDNIQFLGFQKKYTDVISYLKSATVFCLASTTEGFGIATVEALASGLPVVLADTPVSREIGGKAAVYFMPNNHVDLAHKLYVLLTDAQRYHSLKQTAKHQAQRFDWHQIAGKTEALYERLHSH